MLAGTCWTPKQMIFYSHCCQCFYCGISCSKNHQHIINVSGDESEWNNIRYISTSSICFPLYLPTNLKAALHKWATRTDEEAVVEVRPAPTLVLLWNQTFWLLKWSSVKIAADFSSNTTANYPHWLISVGHFGWRVELHEADGMCVCRLQDRLPGAVKKVRAEWELTLMHLHPSSPRVTDSSAGSIWIKTRVLTAKCFLVMEFSVIVIWIKCIHIATT